MTKLVHIWKNTNAQNKETRKYITMDASHSVCHIVS